ncbi:hypothetical protein V5O48_003466 [Marasmius crinis-equi]|uniref:F-box domain-containing protein n=1 Tax=Marasmius crinis-equi TaxID=585013 RepID=A0ABR3FSS5_9AGAR
MLPHAISQRSTTSAIRMIPIEIWVLVFDIVCLRNQYSLFVNNALSDYQLRAYPVTLSHVCSQWRRIVLSCPQLWSAVSVNFTKLPSPVLPMIQSYLANSCHHTLSVRIARSTSTDPFSSPEEETWKELTRHSSRIRCLQMESNAFHMLDIPLPEDVETLSFPNLTEYRGNFTELFSLPNPWWEALRTAPKLKSVFMSCLHPDSTLPYPQLTKMELNDLLADEIESLFKIFPRCEALEELTIGWTGEEDPNDDEVNLEVVVMTSLRRLSIHGNLLDMDEPLLPEMLASLTMPSLESLSLRYSDFTQRAPWPPSLPAMLSRSSAVLTRLALHIERPKSILSTDPNRSFLILLEQLPNLSIFQLKMGFYESRYSLYESRYSRHKHEYGLDFNNVHVLDLFTRLEQCDHHPSFVPKLASIALELSDIVLRADLANAILDAVVARSRTSGHGRQKLTNVRIRRLPGWKRVAVTKEDYGVDAPDELGSDSSFTQRIEDLGRDGITVLLEELAYFW